MDSKNNTEREEVLTQARAKLAAAKTSDAKTEHNIFDIMKSRLEISERYIKQLENDRRFQAAVAAMQGLLANGTDGIYGIYQDEAVELAVKYADLLLTELDRTAGKKEDGE